MFFYSNFYLKRLQLIILIIKISKLFFIVSRKLTPVTIKNSIKWSTISSWLNSKNKPNSHSMSQSLELNLLCKKMSPFLHHTTKSKMLFCTFLITELFSQKSQNKNKDFFKQSIFDMERVLCKMKTNNFTETVSLYNQLMATV